jgi:hypothetical protein
MAGRKKRAARPNLGGTLRPQAEAPRRRFLYTDVTSDEYQKIQQYCRDRQISVSQFLADLTLKDAAKSKTKRKQKVIVNAKLELTPEEQDKLELLARLHQKQSVSEYVRDILEPNLKLRSIHTPLNTTELRFYLSEEEHEKVTKHMASKGISARNYAAMLALRTISRERKKQK